MTIKDCNDCKSYKGCFGKEFFTYDDIRWCPWQVRWIIEHTELLRLGEWPPEPEGHVAIRGKRGYASTAYFTKPVEILAEVERRRKRTGIAGELLKAQILAHLDLSYEAEDALAYIRGYRRKKQSYSAWKKQRRYTTRK